MIAHMRHGCVVWDDGTLSQALRMPLLFSNFISTIFSSLRFLLRVDVEGWRPLSAESLTNAVGSLLGRGSRPIHFTHTFVRQ